MSKKWSAMFRCTIFLVINFDDYTKWNTSVRSDPHKSLSFDYPRTESGSRGQDVRKKIKFS